MGKIIEYTLSVPVFKQGDDLRHSIKTAGNDLPKGFVTQAECYEAAAQICRRMAAVASEHSLEVRADTHYIGVTGPDEVMQALAADGILRAEEHDTEDEDDFVEDDLDDIDDYVDDEDLDDIDDDAEDGDDAAKGDGTDDDGES